MTASDPDCTQSHLSLSHRPAERQGDPNPAWRWALLHPNFYLRARGAQHSTVAMAKSKEPRPAKPEAREKSSKPFVKVDKKAFDPTLASLFASSVRFPHTLAQHHTAHDC